MCSNHTECRDKGFSKIKDKEKEKKMPQLDILSYSTQLIWMIISFGILYIFIENWLIPRIEEIIKVRKYKLGMNKEGEIQGKEKVETEVKIEIENLKESDKSPKISKRKEKKGMKTVKNKYLKEIVKKIMKINKK